MESHKVLKVKLSKNTFILKNSANNNARKHQKLIKYRKKNHKSNGTNIV